MEGDPNVSPMVELSSLLGKFKSIEAEASKAAYEIKKTRASDL